MATQNNESELLISLLRAAMQGKQLNLSENIDYAAILSLSKHHSVANIVCYALEHSNAAVPQEIMVKLCKERDIALMQDLQQQADFEQLCEAFAKADIRFIPLKGILIKALYPQSDYRTMSDIDLLIDESNADKVQQTMLSLGYSAKSIGHDVHDVYHKQPATSVEVHRELFGAEGEEYASLFADPWKTCTNTFGTKYEFTPTTFFKYLLAHGMKHYAQGGTGIRTFIDINTYLHKYEEHIDLERIYADFESVGQRQLCEDFIALSKVWFEGDTHTEHTQHTAEYILNGGTYGTFENQVQHELKSKGRVRYIFAKLFPRLKVMQERYPVLKKIPVLLPVFWMVRIATKPIQNRHQNLEKIKTLTKK